MTQQVLSEDAFKAAIQRYIKANELGGPKGFAERFGRKVGTVEGWLYKGVKKASQRARIISELPEVFNSSGADENPSSEANTSSPTLGPTPTSWERELLVALKCETTSNAVLILLAQMEWFLFKATPAERDRLRDMLGDQWKRFLELVRAMTSETAFKVAREEGRL